MIAVRVVKTPFWRPSEQVIEEAYRAIRSGGLVVGPTDTVYGIFSDVYNDEYVEKVFLVKRREKSKPLPVLVSSIAAVEEIVEINNKLRAFLAAIWPGPITIVFNDIDCNIFSSLVCRDNSIALRVPAAPFPRKLAEMNGGFITGSSANISGEPSPLNIEEAIHYFNGDVQIYVDSGETPLKVPSTIVSINDRELSLIRQGAVDYVIISRIYRRIMSG